MYETMYYLNIMNPEQRASIVLKNIDENLTITVMSDLISMTFFLKKNTDLQGALKFNFHNCISILYNTILNMAIFLLFRFFNSC